jgi:hypothetical protein
LSPDLDLASQAQDTASDAILSYRVNSELPFVLIGRLGERLPLARLWHLSGMMSEPKSEIQLPVPNNRTPAEPMPSPIKEPPSPMENPDAPVREPDPEEPQQI